MAENEPRESRRTSILKQIDMNPMMRGGFSDENEPTSTFTFSATGFRRQSRRVSFAERTEIKEFRKHEAILPDPATAPTQQSLYNENLVIAEVSYQSSTDGMEVTYSSNHHVTQHMNISAGSVVMEQTTTLNITTASHHQDMEITHVSHAAPDPEPARDEQCSEMEIPGDCLDKDGDCNMDITTVSGVGDVDSSFNTEVDLLPEVNHASFNAEMDMGDTVLASDATRLLLSKSIENTCMQETLQLLAEPSPHKEPLAVSFGMPSMTNSTLHFLQDTLHLSTVKPTEEFHLTLDETQSGSDNVTLTKDLNHSLDLAADLLPSSAPEQKDLNMEEPVPLPIQAGEVQSAPEFPSAMEDTDVLELGETSAHVPEHESITELAPLSLLPVLENTGIPETSLNIDQSEVLQSAAILNQSAETCIPVPDTPTMDILPSPATEAPETVPGSSVDVPAVAEVPSSAPGSSVDVPVALEPPKMVPGTSVDVPVAVEVSAAMEFSINATLPAAFEVSLNPGNISIMAAAMEVPADVPVPEAIVPAVNLAAEEPEVHPSSAGHVPPTAPVVPLPEAHATSAVPENPAPVFPVTSAPVVPVTPALVVPVTPAPVLTTPAGILDSSLTGLPSIAQTNVTSGNATASTNIPSCQTATVPIKAQELKVEEPIPVRADPPVDAVAKFLRTWKWGFPWKAAKEDDRLSLTLSKGRFIVTVHLGDQLIRDHTLHYYIKSYTFQTNEIDSTDMSKPFRQLGYRLLQNTLVKSDLKRLCPTTEKLGALLDHLLDHEATLQIMECDVGWFLCRVLEEKIDLSTSTIHCEMSNHRSNVAVNVSIALRDAFPLKLRSISFAPVIGTLKDVDQLTRMVKQIGPDRHYLAKVARCIDDYLEFKK